MTTATRSDRSISGSSSPSRPMAAPSSCASTTSSAAALSFPTRWPWPGTAWRPGRSSLLRTCSGSTPDSSAPSDDGTDATRWQEQPRGVRCNRAYTPFMVTLRRVASLVAFVLGLLSLAAPAAGAGDHIALLRMSGTIDQVNASYITEGLKSAADGGAAAVIIEIDSPGGELVSMDDMLKAILASPIPVITWVAPEGAGAGSAATFITLAGDVAAMAPSTSIGAAAVVGSNGQNLPSTEATKVTNFYAAKIHQLAAAHDRNAAWAESAVRTAASVGAA